MAAVGTPSPLVIESGADRYKNMPSDWLGQVRTQLFDKPCAQLRSFGSPKPALGFNPLSRVR